MKFEKRNLRFWVRGFIQPFSGGIHGKNTVWYLNIPF